VRRRRSASCPAALGINVNGVASLPSTLGEIGPLWDGAENQLYFPGIWSEALRRVRACMAVALVIFARWSPRRCLAAAGCRRRADMGPSLHRWG